MNQINIYNTNRKTTYIGVPRNQTIPTEVAKHYGTSTLFKTVDLDDPQPLIAMNKAAVAADIAANGFAVIGVKITTSVGGRK